MKIKELIISVITIGIIVVLPHAALIPGFGYSIVILLWVWLALKYTGVTFSDLGFSFRRFEPKAMLFGSLVAVVVLTFMQLVFFPALELMVSLDYDDAGLNDTIQENRWQFMLMVILGWLIGGFYEEIVFHGYLFTRLEKMIPGKYATNLSFVITAFLFGIYHLQLGALGVINALIVGAVYLGLFLSFKRNLWYSIMCHGVYNTLVMTLIYFDYL